MSRRLAAEFVPCWAAVLLVLFLLPVLPALTGWGLALLGLLAWWIGSALLRSVRARPRVRKVYRIALLLHVIVWSSIGLSHTRLRPAGEPELQGVHDWGRPTSFRIGVGEARLSLPEHVTLAGWGAAARRPRWPGFLGFGVAGRFSQSLMSVRTDGGAAAWPLFHGATNVADHDLSARALVLLPDDLPDAAPVAFVRMDMVTMDARLSQAVLDALAPRGYRAETLTLSATHTHSGPGGYSPNSVAALGGTGHHDPVTVAALTDAAVEAVLRAERDAVPGALRYRTVQSSDDLGRPILGRNRLYGDDAHVDVRVRVLEAFHRKTAELVGTLVNHAVHPVVHRAESRRLERDLAGAVEDAVAARTGAPALFLNGAAGDITFRHGEDGRAERMERLSRDFAARFDVPPGQAGPLATQLRVRAARVQRDLGTPHLVTTSGERQPLAREMSAGPWRGGWDAVLSDTLMLPVNVLVWSSGIVDARLAFRFGGGVGVQVDLGWGFDTTTLDVGAMELALGPEDGGMQRVTVLWTPGEATEAVGRRWREQNADGLLLGYTGGIMGYVTTRQEFARDAYEARSTLYGEGTVELMGEALRVAYDAARIPSGDG